MFRLLRRPALLWLPKLQQYLAMEHEASSQVGLGVPKAAAKEQVGEDKEDEGPVVSEVSPQQAEEQEEADARSRRTVLRDSDVLEPSDWRKASSLNPLPPRSYQGCV
jgi:hypothetical protein